MTLVKQAGVSFVDIAILRFLLFALMKAFQDYRAPWYLRGVVCPGCGHTLKIFTDDVEAPRYRWISAPVRKPKTPTCLSAGMAPSVMARVGSGCWIVGPIALGAVAIVCAHGALAR